MPSPDNQPQVTAQLLVTPLDANVGVNVALTQIEGTGEINCAGCSFGLYVNGLRGLWSSSSQPPHCISLMKEHVAYFFPNTITGEAGQVVLSSPQNPDSPCGAEAAITAALKTPEGVIQDRNRTLDVEQSLLNRTT